MNQIYSRKFWSEKYTESYIDLFPRIKKLTGIAVLFNTNVDAIIHFSPDDIRKLIKKTELTQDELLEGINQWKGIIEHPKDFVVGLCGCFQDGKASEWIIANENIYRQLNSLLPKQQTYRMGGQAGIMANALADLGVPRIFVHVSSLSSVQKKLFNESPNIVIPQKENAKIHFIQPKKAKTLDKSPFMHYIAEFEQNACLQLTGKLEISCPRSNRFIATYDPPNAGLKIMPGFKEGLETIAQKSDAFLVSGFHMFDLDNLGKKKLLQKLSEIFKLLQKAKEINPKLIIHLEMCSIKNAIIAEALVDFSKKYMVWDSLGCNERELVQLLSLVGLPDLSKKIDEENASSAIITGCEAISACFKLQRLHFHHFGYYLVLTNSDYKISPSNVQNALCYASIITAHKAVFGEIPKKLSDVTFYQNSFHEPHTFPENYQQLIQAVIGTEFSKNSHFPSIYSSDKYHLIAIPTIVIVQPRYTVGLGDTISSSALAAEIAYFKD
jgi:ADP-dependent phosphofructokinase/glucokinase